jgi:hypothetical protein
MSTGKVTLGEISTITSGNVTMTVEPRTGGRIIGFALGGKDILLPASAVAGTENANNFGVTFWPSPQSAWGWPPVAAIDSLAFSAEGNAAELLLTSQPGTLPDGAVIALTKRFAPVAGKDAVDVTYRLVNQGSVPIRLATWQIARVRAGGLTFFKLGAGGVSSDKLATVTAAGAQWYAYDAAVVVEQGQKTFADATGWVAHLEGDLLFVQAYPDVMPGAAAPGEAEMELYADPSHTYVEIEPQGAVGTIAAGAEGPAWTVRCFLTRLPSNIQAEVGNADLVEFVEQLIQG